MEGRITLIPAVIISVMNYLFVANMADTEVQGIPGQGGKGTSYDIL